MRVPRFLNNFLMNRGFQNAVPEGEEWVDTGVNMWERGTDQCFLEVTNWRALFRFLLGLR